MLEVPGHTLVLPCLRLTSGADIHKHPLVSHSLYLKLTKSVNFKENRDIETQ